MLSKVTKKTWSHFIGNYTITCCWLHVFVIDCYYCQQTYTNSHTIMNIITHCKITVFVNCIENKPFKMGLNNSSCWLVYLRLIKLVVIFVSSLSFILNIEDHSFLKPLTCLFIVILIGILLLDIWTINMKWINRILTLKLHFSRPHTFIKIMLCYLNLRKF